MQSYEQLKKHLKDLEAQLQQREVRASQEQLDELIADDFYEIGVSGTVWTKPAVIEALKDESFSQRSISDFSLTMLAAEVALVTYRGHRYATPERPSADSLRSSIWKYFDGKWKMVFHQGTPLT